MDTNIKKPLVSVIMPTYNRADTILNSIKSVMDQNYSNLELIIIDDASTDSTEKLIKGSFVDDRIKYIKNEVNLGISKNRNKGISISTGVYIAMLDSDDIWTDKTKLEKQVEFLENNKDHTFVGTFFMKINKDKKQKIVYETEDKKIRDKILIRNQFSQSTILLKKSILEKSGTYDESLIIWEDWDLWLRIGKESKFANLPIYTMNYAVHDSNISKNKILLGYKITKQIINKYKKNYSGYLIALLKNNLRLLLQVVKIKSN